MREGGISLIGKAPSKALPDALPVAITGLIEALLQTAEAPGLGIGTGPSLIFIHYQLIQLTHPQPSPSTKHCRHPPRPSPRHLNLLL